MFHSAAVVDYGDWCTHKTHTGNDLKLTLTQLIKHAINKSCGQIYVKIAFLCNGSF
jgi:hypothetical protein